MKEANLGVNAHIVCTVHWHHIYTSHLLEHLGLTLCFTLITLTSSRLPSFIKLKGMRCQHLRSANRKQPPLSSSCHSAVPPHLAALHWLKINKHNRQTCLIWMYFSCGLNTIWYICRDNDRDNCGSGKEILVSQSEGEGEGKVTVGSLTLKVALGGNILNQMS